jgi:hypothetical protein
MNFVILEHFSKICHGNPSLVKNLTGVMGILHEGQCVFFIKSRSVLRMRNVLENSCRENEGTF